MKGIYEILRIERGFGGYIFDIKIDGVTERFSVPFIHITEKLESEIEKSLGNSDYIDYPKITASIDFYVFPIDNTQIITNMDYVKSESIVEEKVVGEQARTFSVLETGSVQEGPLPTKYKYKTEVKSEVDKKTYKAFKAKVVDAIDGDTIKVVVTDNILFSAPTIDNDKIQIGEEFSIRLSCIEARETDKGDGFEGSSENNYSTSKNRNWLAKNGIETTSANVTRTFMMAEEAKKFIEATIVDREILIVVDHKQDLSPKGKGIDKYGRILGIPYVIIGDKYYNISRSMIMNESAQFPGHPIAEISVYIKDAKQETMIPLDLWFGDQVKEPVKNESNTKFTDLKNDPLIKIDENGIIKYGDYNEESTYFEYLSNANDVPADNEQYDYDSYTQDDRDKLDGTPTIDWDFEQLLDSGFTRIGDCTFVIPPLSIKIDNISQVTESSALRSKGTVKTQAGHYKRLITIDLYFAGMEQVNGYVYEKKDCPRPEDMVYYRNGLRPLIAQFKTCPFLPIENKELDSAGITSVAFKDLAIETIPGFPGSMKATLILYEFDHTVYMPQEEIYEDAISWKLFRWNYQRMMQPINQKKGRTYLPPISEVNDDLKFYIADENQLLDKQKAMDTLSEMIHPDQFKDENTKNNKNYQDLENDWLEVKKANEEYRRFMAWKNNVNKTYYKLFFDKDGDFVPDFTEIGKLPKGDKENHANELWNMMDSTYAFSDNVVDIKDDGKGNVNKVTKEISFIVNRISSVTDFLNKYPQQGKMYYAYSGIKLAKLAPSVLRNIGDWLLGETDYLFKMVGNIGAALDQIRDGQDDGMYSVYIKNLENRKNMNPTVDSNCYIRVSDPKFKESITAIENDFKNANALYENYESEYNNLKKLATQTESNLRMISWDLPGEIYIQNMQSQISNVYSQAQPQAADSPALQYMGSQDARLSLILKTKSLDVIQSLNSLFSEAHRLSRTYREGITSSMIKIDNNLINILGVRDILVESLSVKTSETDVESYVVDMRIIGFDRTQKLKEGLEQISYSDYLGDEEELKRQLDAFEKMKAKDEIGFELGIIDHKLRMLEVYPDLELPTFYEVNQALPHLEIYNSLGKKFDYYKNPTGARFVDPDFYIRYGSTLRDYFWSMLNEETKMMMTDRHGFEAIETSPAKGKIIKDPNVQFSEETQTWADENLSSIEYAEFPKQGQVKQDGQTPTPIQNTDEKDNGKNGQSKTTLTKEEESNFNNMIISVDMLKQSPALTTKFGRIERGETRLNSIYLTEAINKNKLAVSNSKDGIDKVLVKATNSYMNSNTGKNEPIENILSSCEIEIGEISKKNPDKGLVHRLIEQEVAKCFASLVDQKKDVKNGKKYITTYVYGSATISAPEMTQQKVVNIMKSIIDYTSKFRHFDNNGKVIFDGSTRVGLCGVNIKNNLVDTYIASKTWEGNIKESVKYFAACYNKAVNGKHNEEAKKNPLDWAIAIYGQRSFDTKLSSLNNSGFYIDVITYFKKIYGASSKFYNASNSDLSEKNSVTAKEAQTEMYKIRNYCLEQKGSMNKDFWKGMIRDIYGEHSEDGERWFVESLGLNFNPDVSLNGFIIEVAIHELGGIVNKYSSLFDKGTTLKYYKGDNTRKLFNAYEITNKIPFVVIDPFNQIDKGTEELKKDKELEKYFNSIRSGYKFDPVRELIHRDLRTKFSKDNTSRKPFDFTNEVIVVNKDALKNALKIYDHWMKNNESKITMGHMNHIDLSGVYKLKKASDPLKMQETYSDNLDTIAQTEWNAIHSFKQSPEDISHTFKNAFRDIIEYDHRGRLLRAFPTYQMFIIDEGRYSSWHRMWDKFYGYNSILSIDVMKDRRTPADTAIINISNAYGTLSSDDTTINTGDSSVNAWDLWGLGLTPDSKDAWAKIFGVDYEDIARASKERISSLSLKPGARINLRMGYGSNAFFMPIVFNGTIAELSTGEVITVVAQGDGIELTNKIVDGEPGDSTDPGILSLPNEPRKAICEFMSNKEGKMSNLIYRASKGRFKSKNPLGIVHFGVDLQPNTFAPLEFGLSTMQGLKAIYEEEAETKRHLENDYKSWEDYGEIGVNVYTGSSIESLSQWIYTDGPKEGKLMGMKWGNLVPTSWMQGDAPNVQIYTFDKTVWEVIQSYAAACPDYIAATMPFEYRSTLFFGKPWWGVMDRYVYQYRWDEELKTIVREAKTYYRKTFSQLRYYDSNSDILSNNIVASDEEVYTNVIGLYNEEDGSRKTPLIQVDADINPDQQTTATVHLPIKGNWWTTQEKYAEACATTALRDYVKLMYQGELVIIGDPSVKPHDSIYMNDTINRMNGLVWARRVTHHMSLETGFVTTITPDCCATVDDMQGASFLTWASGKMIGVAATTAGIYMMSKNWKKITNLPMARLLKRSGESGIRGMIVAALSKDARDTSMAKIRELGEAVKGKDLTEFARDFRSFLQNPDNATEAVNKMDDFIQKNSKYKWISDLSASNKDRLAKFGSRSGELVGKGGGYIVNKAVEFKNKNRILNSKFAKNAGGMGTKGFTALKGGIDKGLTPVLKAGAKVSPKIAKGAALLVGSVFWPVLLGEVALMVISENLIEHYQRWLKNRQAILIIPLKYKGLPFTAGVNGHRGCVYGDEPSKMDKFLMGDSGGVFGGVVKTANFLMGVDVDYDNQGIDLGE